MKEKDCTTKAPNRLWRKPGATVLGPSLGSGVRSLSVDVAESLTFP